jgi:hypothetical protein
MTEAELKYRLREALEDHSPGAIVKMLSDIVLDMSKRTQKEAEKTNDEDGMQMSREAMKIGHTLLIVAAGLDVHDAQN